MAHTETLCARTQFPSFVPLDLSLPVAGAGDVSGALGGIASNGGTCAVASGVAATEQLAASGRFSNMNLQTDEDEHSIEMHLPYIRQVFEGYV